MNASLPAICLAVSLALGCEADFGDGRSHWIAFSRTLTPEDAAGFSTPFTVTDDGPQEIRIEFAWPITNREAADFAERAGGAVGIPGKTPEEFDLSWQVLKGAEEIARGEGRDGLTGTIQDTGRGLGEGPPISLDYVFGAFPATTGVTYTLRLVPGGKFAPILRASPSITIGRKLEP